ncbi:MAG: EamA family transporter [Magnetococcales bacterium]|nr:EamA family transporter [Magnetococcales bacterium]
MNNRILAVGLALAIFLDTASQLLWKAAVATLPSTPDLFPVLQAIRTQPLFLLVGILFLCQLFNWLKVLQQADLSFAQPITSLSYVAVSLLSARWLDESLGLLKGIGIFCILAGVWLISQGQRLTDPAGLPP